MNSDTTSIYLSDSSSSEELIRGFQISLMGIEVKDISSATFKPPATLSSWKQWCEGLFKGILVPHFTKVYTEAGLGHTIEIIEFDQALDRALEEDVREKSVAAAQLFLDTKNEGRHMPQWARFEEKIRDGETPGHLATLFAIQSSLFNVPLMNALMSYALFEWSGVKPEGNSDTFAALQFVRQFVKPDESSFGLRSI